MADETKPTEPRAPQSPVIDLEAETVSEAADTPPPASSVPAKKFRAGLWGGTALALIAALFGGWLYRGYGTSLWPTDAMTDLGSRMGVIESTAKTLDTQIRGLGGAVDQLKTGAAQTSGTANEAAGAAKTARDESASAAAAVAALTGRLEIAERAVASAQSSITAIQKSIAGGGAVGPLPVDTAAVEALAKRVGELEKTVAALKSGGTAAPDAETAALLSQTLADIKAKLANGAPYAEELARLRQLVPAAQGLEELSASAVSGLPTTAMLAGQLAKLGPALPGAEPEAAPAESGTWDWFTSMLSGVVTIRDLGETNWRDVAAKAQAFAEAGDLAQAIGTIAAAEGEMPPALGGWLASARARVAGDAALDSVAAAVLRQIAAIGGTP